jgi:transposase
MRPTSVFVRFLTPKERQQIERGLRSAEVFLVRRCQIVLASEYGAGVPRVARQGGCSDQTVRKVVHAFHPQGVACLQRRSSRPPTTRERVGGEETERLQALWHQSPRTFGSPTSLGTLEIAAAVSFAQGLTPQPVSREAIRSALPRLGVGWQRAKRCITSPAPAYARKKSSGPPEPLGGEPSRVGTGL